GGGGRPREVGSGRGTRRMKQGEEQVAATERRGGGALLPGGFWTPRRFASRLSGEPGICVRISRSSPLMPSRASAIRASASASRLIGGTVSLGLTSCHDPAFLTVSVAIHPPEVGRALDMAARQPPGLG